jgi:hypothetical protein
MMMMVMMMEQGKRSDYGLAEGLGSASAGGGGGDGVSS